MALARALVKHPTVLLLDEPLGALDLKLRREMQLELKALQHRVGITFVYVTHDQEEAITMSDIVMVMHHGRVQQQGAPRDLYEQPVRTPLSGMDRTLTEASYDLYATPARTFFQVTLPQLMPAIVTGALLAFTFSFDDYIVARFVAGAGQPTLPMYVFATIRRGVTPEINAIATMVLAVTVMALVLAGLAYRRQARQGRSARPDEG